MDDEKKESKVSKGKAMKVKVKVKLKVPMSMGKFPKMGK